MTVIATSTGNECFVNGYDSQIPVINAIYWECGATLQGGQTIKQNIFRSSELYGSFTLTVTTSSNPVTLVVYENGVSVFSETGMSITWSSTQGVTQNEPMYITIANSEPSNTTAYTLAIDWTGV